MERRKHNSLLCWMLVLGHAFYLVTYSRAIIRFLNMFFNVGRLSTVTLDNLCLADD